MTNVHIWLSYAFKASL